jgi:ADP-ribose pyrophosphatase YjhB (NUDIX family)
VSSAPSSATAFPLAVNVAVIDEQHRVLLTRREDFEVWCLPGGTVDEGESLAEAAIREVREETGFEVQLEHLVGLYSRSRLGGYHTGVLFSGSVTGGSLQPDPREVIEICWCSAAEVPNDLLWGQRERIEDALAGKIGVVRATDLERPDIWPRSRSEHYELRDRSGLSRPQFYRRLVDALGEDPSRLEVKGVDGRGLAELRAWLDSRHRRLALGLFRNVVNVADRRRK